MQADYYAAMAWDGADYYAAMAWDGAVYCTEHLPRGVTEEMAYPVFASSEWDAPPYCDDCGKMHYYVNLIQKGGGENTMYHVHCTCCGKTFIKMAEIMLDDNDGDEYGDEEDDE